MKVGGYAHSRGITFYNSLFKVNASYCQGKIIDSIQWIIPPKWLVKIEKVPILGGVTLLYYQWKIFSNKVKFLYLALIAMLLIDELFNFSYQYQSYFKWAYLAIFVIAIFKIKTIMRVFRFHGAEHKVINCYGEHGNLDYNLVKGASRFNKRCGSNLVIIFLILYSIMWILNLDSLPVLALMFLVTIQVMKILIKKETFFDKYINLLQYITVQEPREEELYLAVEAFNKLVQATNIYKMERRLQERKET